MSTYESSQPETAALGVSPAATEPAPPAGPEQPGQPAGPTVAELQVELAETKERWMRAEAEIANVRARAKREVDETRQYAVQKFASDVAEAAENLRRGLESIPAAGEREPELVGRLRDGFAGVERALLAVLERNGIHCEDPTGALFDPNLHQAMAEQESAEHPPGTVVQAWSPVWTLNGRLLRPAMVVVAKAPVGGRGDPAGGRVNTTA
jgi:molecular chaperone GrpE